MLRGRSIRAKLLTAFVSLFALFLLFVIGVSWGLSRYGAMADAVSRRMAEIPYPDKLNALALAMKDGVGAEGFLSDSGMIESSTFMPAQVGTHRADVYMEYAIEDFEVTLDRYDAEFSKQSEITRLEDDAQQAWVIKEIGRTFSDVKLANLRRDPLDPNRANLRRLINELCVLTGDHLSQVQSGISQISVSVRQQYRSSIRLAVFCALLAVLMIAGAWWVFHTQVARPFRTLLDGSRLVAEGQLAHRIDLGTSDELSELANAINGMSERFTEVVQRERDLNADLDRQVKERSREVIQNEQLASVGFLAAGVAHEINNPLASIAFSSEVLERQFDDLIDDVENPDQELYAGIKKNLVRVQDEAFRCSDITKKLLDFSRLGDVRRTSTDLSALVEDVVALVRKVGKFRCTTVRTHCDPGVFAHINSHEIQQVVLNLVTNAMESVDTDGFVDVFVRNHGMNAQVVVEDNGCGMSKEVMEHLFEPFFTRRQDGTGTGLGLSITRRIVSQHHGSLVAHSDGEGLGARLELLLPVEAYSENTINAELLGGNDAKKAA